MIAARDGDNDALLARLKKIPHFAAWKKADVPARLHYSDEPAHSADRRHRR